MRAIVDHNLPPSLADALGALKEDLGLEQVSTPNQLLEAVRTPDEHWLARCGQAPGEQWFGLTQDFDILRERTKAPWLVWQQHRIPLLVLRRGWTGLSGAEILTPLLRHWPRVSALAQVLQASSSPHKVAGLVLHGQALTISQLIEKPGVGWRQEKISPNKIRRLEIRTGVQRGSPAS